MRRLPLPWVASVLVLGAKPTVLPLSSRDRRKADAWATFESNAIPIACRGLGVPKLPKRPRPPLDSSFPTRPWETCRLASSLASNVAS